MNRLKGKVIIVTGSTSGIGAAAAKAIAKEGAKVIVSGRREHLGDQVAAGINSNGGDARFIKCDLAKEDDIKNLINKTVQIYGRIDGAFNNAGIIIPSKSLADSTLEEYNTVFDTNLKAIFLCMKYEILQMRKQTPKGGSIVNCSSVVSIRTVGPGLYAATKSAVDTLTRHAAAEEALNSIRINSILPGPIDTDIFKSYPDEQRKQFKEKLKNSTAMKRLGQPEEITGPVIFMLTDEASYVTGSFLTIDGGIATQ